MSNTLSGNLDIFSLADLLQWLEINALSGRVTVSRGEVRRTIDLKAGSIVFVSSSRPDERLGVFLAHRSFLSNLVVYDLLAENFVSGKNLTRLVLDRGLLTREQLAEAVEALATHVLLDLFHWSGARFEFDPLFKIEDLLNIQLSLRGQVLAFQGAKSLDDSARIPALAAGGDDFEARWEKEFHADVLAGSFWSILESIPGDGAGPGTIRDRFYAFNLFADAVHRQLRDPFHPFPIFDDTAAMLLTMLDDKAEEERLVQIAALDPFLTLDLLYLGNALQTVQTGLASTAREAAETIGPGALRSYLALLAAPAAPKIPSLDRMERAVRRAALSTAVAASHLAPAHSVDAELAYTLGLAEPLGGYDLLKLLRQVDFEPGPFRALALASFRPLYGRVLARKLNLPRMLEDVLGSVGQVTARSAPSEQLIFLARQLAPAEQIGREWTSEDPELADRYASLTRNPELAEKITRDASALREILKL